MKNTLERRRSLAEERLSELQRELGEAERLASGKACVYLTGSFGRGEASRHSDLDLFIAGQGTRERPELCRLDEICVKASLICAVRKCSFPDFSGDGEYLKSYTFSELAHNLGTPEDDVSNTLTARLLLLLESRPLFGDAVYKEGIKTCLGAYWRDYEDHEDSFSPAFLANDILRLWRTFCVNYEARTKTEPEEQKAKRKLKNYKLKHSRLLTCYSALLYLLAVYESKETVTIEDAFEMVRLTPTERLEWLAKQAVGKSSETEIQSVLESYEAFLTVTDDSKEKLIPLFQEKSKSNELVAAANRFGDQIWQILEKMGWSAKQRGKGYGLFRQLVV